MVVVASGEWCVVLTGYGVSAWCTGRPQPWWSRPLFHAQQSGTYEHGAFRPTTLFILYITTVEKIWLHARQSQTIPYLYNYLRLGMHAFMRTFVKCSCSPLDFTTL